MEPKKQYLPVGISDFKELIEEHYYFVDKSLFIKELLDSRAKVTLIPRPRRFGKTLNMSMVRYFFEKTEESRRHLFDGLKIEEHAGSMAHQGKYPVVWLTFKDVKTAAWADCYRLLCMQISAEFERHSTVIRQNLSDVELERFERVRRGTGDLADFMRSLLDLSAYLERTHRTKVVILIDEYDAPIHAAFDHGYYDDVVDFMRNFLSGGFKDNAHLEFGILTGILRIAKESIFSGLNNLRVCTLLGDAYSDKFGLLEYEVVGMLTYFGFADALPVIRAWYDGYQSGRHKIYNPWSVVSMLDHGGEMKPYWANTSGNDLLKKVLRDGPDGVKEDCEKILRGETITKEIDENVVMPELFTNESAAWNLLMMSGYLTFDNYRPDPQFEGSHIADLKIPNTEVSWIYRTQILSWFQATTSSARQYQSMLKSLIEGRRDDFKQFFTRFAQEPLSTFDVTGTHPERFYHGFVLGMLASLRDSYEVVSNHESGWGRYDVCIFPKDLAKPGIIFEFKAVDRDRYETLESEANKALEQIEKQQYEAVMRARGITNVVKIGIAFDGKKNLIMFG